MKLRFKIVIQDFQSDETYPVTSSVRKQVKEYLTQYLTQDIENLFKINVDCKITVNGKNQVTIEFDTSTKEDLDRSTREDLKDTINTIIENQYDFGQTNDGNILLNRIN